MNLHVAETHMWEWEQVLPSTGIQYRARAEPDGEIRLSNPTIRPRCAFFVVVLNPLHTKGKLLVSHIPPLATSGTNEATSYPTAFRHNALKHNGQKVSRPITNNISDRIYGQCDAQNFSQRIYTQSTRHAEVFGAFWTFASKKCVLRQVICV